MNSTETVEWCRGAGRARKRSQGRRAVPGGRAEKLARGEDRELVALTAVGVEGEAPALLVAEKAQAAEMSGGVAQPLHHLLAALRPVRRRPIRARRLRLRVGVDVAELATKANVEPRVAAGQVLLG